MKPVGDLSCFMAERNLVMWIERIQASDGNVYSDPPVLWCEAVDRNHARYIAFALNKIGREELFNGNFNDYFEGENSPNA